MCGPFTCGVHPLDVVGPPASPLGPLITSCSCHSLQVQHLESRLEPSLFTSAGVNEDLALNDQMVDILSSEDPADMLQALEE